MEEKWVVACYTHYGDDWSSHYKDVFEDEEEAKKFEAEHKEEHKDVNGIEHIDFYYSYETEKQLRSTLTVNEYIQLFPNVKEMLDNMHE
ncbi:MAG: hypothetical protein WD512_09015 [Candidatus Paceibacterota bacterium]